MFFTVMRGKRFIFFLLSSTIICFLILNFSLRERKLLLKNFPSPLHWKSRSHEEDDVKEQLLRMKTDNDPELFSLICRHFLDPPSTKGYNLEELLEKWGSNIPYLFYKEVYPSWVFIRSIVLDLFGESTPGFFVEAGAFDGEYLSNTLMLEKDYNWTGLLVEANRRSYETLIRKHRRSWTTPLCLATERKPHKVLFTTSCFGHRTSLIDKASNRVVKDANVVAGSCFHEAFCVPASSLLRSLNISKVDFFSLDVEEMELEVLRSFPFDEIHVDVWAVEHIFRNYIKELKKDPNSDVIQDVSLTEFMESKGYYLFDILCTPIADYIFVRRESKIFKRLQVPKQYWKRRNICKTKGLLGKKTRNIPSHLRDWHHFPNIKYTNINQ